MSPKLSNNLYQQLALFKIWWAMGQCRVRPCSSYSDKVMKLVIAQWSGGPTNPKEEFKMRKTNLDLMAERPSISLMTSCRLMTISLC